MHEIEAKVRVPELETTAAKLKAIGAAFLCEVRESDLYLDCQGQLKQNGCGLRIRRQDGGQRPKAMVTFKGAKVKSVYKSRPEYEMEVSSAETAERIFAGLGYAKRIIVEKTRHQWQLDACVVCLDDVSGLGCFVEVEGPDENAIGGVLRKLDLQDEPHIQTGYAEMLAKSRQ